MPTPSPVNDAESFSSPLPNVHAVMGVACEPKLWIVCRLVRGASYRAKSSAGAWCWPWVEWS